MKEPKIRFKEFKGEWETSRLDSCVDFLDNLRKPIEEGNRIKGIYPYYGASRSVDYVNDCIFVEELILLSEDGANITDRNYPVCFLASGKYWVNNHAHVLKAKDGFVNCFVSNAMERKDYSQYNTGMAMPKLNKEVCKNIPLTYPLIEEQQSIASFFTTIDAQISASTSRLASLKQIKAASLQAMFPQEGETVPKLRFKGFEGEWEKVKLNTFAKRVTRKNTNLESTLALTIASAQGLVSQIDYFNNLVIGSNICNYYLLYKGEFAYNKSYSNGYPFGSVKRLDRYEKGILSTLYITFSIDDSISSDYLTQFFETTLWHKEVAERSAEGARNHGLLNIGAEDFLTINIVKPQSKEEQQMISDYFISLDRQITLQTQRLEKLKQIKAACLDKMFV